MGDVGGSLSCAGSGNGSGAYNCASEPVRMRNGDSLEDGLVVDVALSESLAGKSQGWEGPLCAFFPNSSQYRSTWEKKRDRKK